jgi:hypothetical protein
MYASETAGAVVVIVDVRRADLPEVRKCRGGPKRPKKKRKNQTIDRLRQKGSKQ